jgi:hypothetical protein
MEMSCSWEATSCAATQEFPNILDNSVQEVFYFIFFSHGK